MIKKWGKIMDHSLRISIVTHNSERIFNVLTNLIEVAEDIGSCVLSVFDNNSNQAYKNKLLEYESRVDLFFSDENRGFGYGHNFNLLTANEEFFLVFNPDVVIDKSILIDMMNSLANDEAGMLVPKVVFSNGEAQHIIRSRFTVFDWFVRRVPTGNVFKKRIDDFECVNLPEDRKSYVNLSSGCFMLLKSEVFKAVNGFDNRFFMYLEDYDLCRRVNQVSKIVYVPDYTVIHFWERASSKSPKMFLAHLNSIAKYFNKWGWEFY